MLGTVVIVNDYAYVNGGAGWVALSTAKALKKKRISSYIIFWSRSYRCRACGTWDRGCLLGYI